MSKRFFSEANSTLLDSTRPSLPNEFLQLAKRNKEIIYLNW